MATRRRGIWDCRVDQAVDAASSRVEFGIVGITGVERTKVCRGDILARGSLKGCTEIIGVGRNNLAEPALESRVLSKFDGRISRVPSQGRPYDGKAEELFCHGVFFGDELRVMLLQGLRLKRVSVRAFHQLLYLESVC